MDKQPLVSCILPTYNRRAFLPRAMEYFLQQDYPARELLILDDGSDPVGDLVPDDGRIHYTRLERRLNIGEKRNLANQQARGEYILHWDDDDWMAPWRISYQVDALIKSGADVCGLAELYFYAPQNDRAWEYSYQGDDAWVHGATMAYRRDVWQRTPFPDVQVGEDVRWLRSQPGLVVLPLDDRRFFVGTVHAGNASPKDTSNPAWKSIESHIVKQVMSAESRPSHRKMGSQELAQPQLTLRFPGQLAVARQSDMDLEEFAAYNHKTRLPHMRRWEQPYALFHMALGNSGAILDLTINPAGFEARLKLLYPDVRYEHRPAIQDGQFTLPEDVPDGAFERVVCINTLEHLLAEQRALLVQAAARKLKPGGKLVWTCDYYFDSAWETAAFLDLGVMRTDRQDVFNGWNRVTLGEVLALGQANGLQVEGDKPAVPEEGDTGLYLNQPPYPHACIAGVFTRPPAAPPAAGKKVMLSLLSWNTRDVSLDSARAMLREAHLLQRLGQQPFLCFCDNGSTDGTQEALIAWEPHIDVPYKFIFNQANLGNSIARNQVIDLMLQENADYVLFTDGDIELVPFSSYAMLRYAENHGEQLGCIGVDSGSHTRQRAQASAHFYAIEERYVQATDLVAWTQYGLFRREVFAAGVRFDENEPFNQPGWGFEDNDLAFQMVVKGFGNRRFYGMTYLHRNAQSSIGLLRQRGVDVRARHALRKAYTIRKWEGVPQINSGPLRHIRSYDLRL